MIPHEPKLLRDNRQSHQTIPLTTGVDTVPGTSGNDVVNGVLDAVVANGTLQLVDSIDGGAGVNTLNVRVNGAVNLDATTSPTLNNIQVINATNLVGVTNIDASIAPKLTTLNSVNSLAALTATNVATGVTTLGLSGVAADDVDFNVTYKSGLTGASDALTINVSGDSAATVANPARYAELNVVGAAANDGFDIVNVKSTGSATRLDKLTVTDNAASTMSKLVVTGDADFRVKNALDFLGTTGTLDASAFTGKLNVAFGADDITVTGGSGNDRFNFAANLTAADKVDGGAGTDTLAISQNVTAASTALNTAINAATSIEILEQTGAIATLDASQITTIKEFAFSGGGATAVTNTANDLTFDFTANAGATTFAPTVDSGNDVLNLKLVSTATAATTITSVGANVYETVNVAVSGTSADEITTLTVNTNGKVVITGSSDFTTTIVGTNGTIDGSAATGKLTLTGEAGNNSIIGGSGNDTITGGNGIDTIDLSKGGQDTVNITAITAAVNRDIVSGFTAGVGGDKVDISTANVLKEYSAASTGFTFDNANNIEEFTFAAVNNSANLAKAGVLDGAELFKAIANEGSSITSIATTNAADVGYIVAYQGGNAYLYYFNASAVIADANITADEVALVGVFKGVAVGALDATNFA